MLTSKTTLIKESLGITKIFSRTIRLGPEICFTVAPFHLPTQNAEDWPFKGNNELLARLGILTEASLHHGTQSHSDADVGYLHSQRSE